MRSLLASLATLALFASCGGGTGAPALPETAVESHAQEATGTETPRPGAPVFATGERADAQQRKRDIAHTDGSDIYLHVGYGWAAGTGGPRCVYPFAGKKCYVPNSKSIGYIVKRHDHAGCYGQYWTDAINRAINGWNSFHQAFQTGFSLYPTTQAQTAVTIYCDADFKEGEGVAAGTDPGDTNCYNLAGGQKLCRVINARIILAGNNIIGNDCAGRTTAQCHQFIENLVRHELGHVQGLGHFPMGQAEGPVLMARNFNDTIFDTVQTATEEEAWWMCEFNPNGGTSGCQ